ncbi:hypothetical protein C9374_008115 [Naegleria lovaniensis]|uniref:F-box domain-containing protein n=1 Tax=Naegleria lovaniensis TaxID=51637 RepID=A0AA88KHS0_NAELO|nr:uncharacterized protein C9374_008115 [Naegleria lovaniensis]KAG2378476.1 hypothetical protein C9374_008115 [Naegleria lovaniensis]
MARVNEFLKQQSLLSQQDEEDSDLSCCSSQSSKQSSCQQSLDPSQHSNRRCKHTFHNSSQSPLPDEIIQYHIVPYMDVKTLCSKFFLLSSYLKKLVDENHIWKERFFRVLPYSQFDFFENNPIYWKKCYHSEVTRRYFSSLSPSHQDRIYPSLDEFSVSFKDLYRTLFIEGQLSKQRLLNSGNYKRDQYSHHITYYYLIDMFESVKLEHDQLRCIDKFFGQQVSPGVEFFRGRTREKGALHDDETREYYGVFGLVVGVYFVMFQEWMSNDLRAHVFGRKINHRMVETYGPPPSNPHRSMNPLFQQQQQQGPSSLPMNEMERSCMTAASTSHSNRIHNRMRTNSRRIPLFASTPRHHHWLLYHGGADDPRQDLVEEDDFNEMDDYLLEDEDSIMNESNTSQEATLKSQTVVHEQESQPSFAIPSNVRDEEVTPITTTTANPMSTSWNATSSSSNIFPQYLFLNQPTEDKWDQQQKHDSPVSVVIHGVWSDNKERCGLFTSENIDWSTTVFDLSTLGSKLYDINYKRLYSVENEVKMFSRMTAFKYWRMVVHYSRVPEHVWNQHFSNDGFSAATSHHQDVNNLHGDAYGHCYGVREYNVTFDCDTYLRGEAALCHHQHHHGASATTITDSHHDATTLSQGGPSQQQQQQHTPHFQIVGNAMDSYISFNMLSRGEHVFLAWCQFDHMKHESKIKTKSALRSKIIYPNNRRDSFACVEPLNVNLNVNEFKLSGIILDREGIKGHLTLEPLQMNHHHHHHVNQ